MRTYTPLTINGLAGLLAATTDADRRWLLLAVLADIDHELRATGD